MGVSIQEYEKALTSLKDAFNFYNEEIIELKKKIIRDAVIQRFEFSFELAWKVSLKIKGVQSSAPKDTIREMARWGLIEDVNHWFEFLDARNQSSHSYDDDVAQKVFFLAIEFIAEADMLLKKLKLT